jgi:hypothetical protein
MRLTAPWVYLPGLHRRSGDIFERTAFRYRSSFLGNFVLPIHATSVSLDSAAQAGLHSAPFHRHHVSVPFVRRSKELRRLQNTPEGALAVTAMFDWLSALDDIARDRGDLDAVGWATDGTATPRSKEVVAADNKRARALFGESVFRAGNRGLRKDFVKLFSRDEVDKALHNLDLLNKADWAASELPNLLRISTDLRSEAETRHAAIDRKTWPDLDFQALRQLVENNMIPLTLALGERGL